MSVRSRQLLRKADLPRVGAAEMIASALRDRILQGEVRPGDALREVDVANAFGVARNTVREALKLLIRSGLATHEVHHGVAVRRITAQDVNDIYALRELLELAAASRAGKLTDGEVASLTKPVEDGQTAIDGGDIWASTMANQAFHKAIIKLLHNPRAEAVHDDLLTELSLGLMLEERNAAAALDWARRNRELLDLFVSGPPGRCRPALAAYLDDARTHLLSYVL
ncbi:MAG TPA: GntR family transcriptional regulator [Candidatus Micrarchaeaceae archaeon]|nr:GntR family transcriptional regulator [Candidatus Micrarchaeaceae archaeon]